MPDLPKLAYPYVLHLWYPVLLLPDRAGMAEPAKLVPTAMAHPEYNNQVLRDLFCLVPNPSVYHPDHPHEEL